VRSANRVASMPATQTTRTFTVDELFKRARHAKRARARWRYVGQLQQLATDAVFKNAVALLAGAKAEDRSLGAYILSQLGYELNAPPFRDRSIRVLLTALETEKASGVLEALVVALSRLYARQAITQIVRLVTHPAVEVRQAIAAELIHTTQERGWGDERPDSRVTAALLKLSRDSVGAVRDWACFSLGNSEQDSPELRDAFVERLRDRHVNTRVEAIAALARRNDRRAIEPLLEILGRRSWRLGSWVTSDLVTFAGRTRDQRFLPYLEDFQTWDLGDDDVRGVKKAIGVDPVTWTP
jgi:HEAT repeat protein